MAERRQMDTPAFDVDIENPYVPLANSLKEEFQSLSPPFSSECSIYRVPERLLHINEKAYTPKVVSIGPLHHGKEDLKAMEAHKKRYLQDFVRRSNVRLEDHIQVVKQKEARLRGCYAETIQFGSDEFVKIILVDAAFIIEVLLKNNFLEPQDKNDCIFNKPWMLQDVWPDLRLLENQLPFFILEDLFDPDKISSQKNERLSIIELSHNFFKKVMHLEGTEEKFEKIRSSKVEHFVDLLRHLHLPLMERPKGKIQTLTTPTMTDLHQAGVTFSVGSSRNLFDIQFSEGKLVIPKLILSDETELSILNLLAFEQLHYGENYINDYVIVMDCLVNTPRDVDLLVKYKIVENRLGGDSNEGSTLINKLGNAALLDYDNFCFASLHEELNKYCGTPWHKWKANLKQNYFNTPWASASVIAAVILLVLTFIQTLCSVMSTYSDGKKH